MMSAQSNPNRSPVDAKGTATDPEQTWSWTCDSIYRVNSISSGFSILTGATTSSFLTGKTWWKACDDLDIPDKRWKPLTDCFEERRRIKKFILSFNHYGKTFKFQISGDPVFTNGKFSGYQGTGSRAGDHEKTWADLNANKIYEILETFQIGSALFCKDDLLDEFDGVFAEHMVAAGLRLEVSMTLSTLKVHLLARNQVVYDQEIESTQGENIRFVDLQLKNQEILSLRFAKSANDRTVIKSEMNPPTKMLKKEFEEIISDLNREKDLITDRLRTPRQRNEPEANSAASSSVESLLSPLVQNYLDIGILCTDLSGKILHVNHFAAGALGFVSVKDCLQSAETHFSLPYYDRHRKEIDEQILEQTLDRKERQLKIGPNGSQLFIREVVTPYPSVFKPEGFFTFWYEVTERGREIGIQKDPNDLIFETAEEFIREARNHNSKLFENSENISLTKKDLESYRKVFEEIQSLFKLRSGGKYFIEEPVSIDEILKICSHEAQQILSDKSVTLNIESLPDAFSILCDRDIFLNAIRAYFLQCIKNTSIGGEISITLRRTLDDSLIFTMSDNGNGFFSTEATAPNGASYNKLTVERMGLEFHKCTVSIKTYTGVGATVRIEIPKFRILNNNDYSADGGGDTLQV